MPHPTRPLHRCTVVITGASSGAGRAAAIRFAKAGADVVLAARREEALNEVAAECEAHGVSALVIPTDVTDAAAVQALAEAASDFGEGTIDVWMNNAGVLAVGPYDEMPVETARRVVETNLLGYMHGAHAALPYFKARGRGVLINNISIGGFLPTPYGVAYTASKFGLRGFSEALQAEVSAWPNIRVVALYPSMLDTPGMQHAANYTGVRLKAAPPVFSPERVARAAVQAAIHPQKPARFPDAASLIFRAGYAVAPGLTRRVAERFMRGYFNRAKPAPHSDGNLFDGDTLLTDVTGGWGRSPAKVILTGAALGALAAGLVLAGRHKR